jgi:hypothetical protein
MICMVSWDHKTLTSAYVSIRQHTSAYDSIRQHTSAYVSIRHEMHVVLEPQNSQVPRVFWLERIEGPFLSTDEASHKLLMYAAVSY